MGEEGGGMRKVEVGGGVRWNKGGKIGEVGGGSRKGEDEGEERGE